ncbi:MAG: 3-deoxy-D-manno-octulosonic acid transferase [Bacteroidetes bacterium]|jgi:3-deoxy-D-manno-octulosonic-acid transferase|nr:3-deoxy-D-manno-octulosonic acid transferase [Bacteroidota bacterium]
MRLLLYRLGLWGYRLVVGLAALLGHAKARKWVQGRRGWRRQLPQFDKPCIWLHAASLGEFEQGRPVLEALRAAWPDVPVLVTFFSPSGYEARQHYDAQVRYLPLDGPATARTWLEAIPIRLAIFVKYDFWYYYLRGLRQRQVPTYLLSASVVPGSSIFRWPQKPLYGQMLACYTHIFTQNEETRKLLGQHFGLSAVSVSGDTRFDRAIQVRATEADFGLIERWLAGRFCILGGSTYPYSEQLLAEAMQQPELQDAAWILAPHTVDEGHIQQILRRYGAAAVRLSALQPGQHSRVLVVDRIGLLARLYRLAQVAYVGGGFQAGIHNILEPAVYGCYTLYGPRHHKFPEGRALQAAGGGCEVQDAHSLCQQLVWAATQPEGLAHRQAQARHFIEQHAGATGRVMQALLAQAQ